MSITACTDTYGRVKTVGGTPIVTKFAMFQGLPIFPLQSYYYTGTEGTETSGVPFIASSQTVVINGIPLARVDRLSAAMAYVRGIFGIMAIFGSVSIVVAVISHFSEKPVDDFAKTFLRITVGFLIVAVIGGGLTYLIPHTSRRERQIRKYCGEVLEICADPARVSADMAIVIEEYASNSAPPDIQEESRLALIQELVSCRSKVAQGLDVYEMERKTHEIVERLDQIS